MNKLSELDAWVLDAVQALYLWLWDRIGVYLATLLFALIVAENVCVWPLEPWNFAFIAIMGAWSTWLYTMQAKSLTTLNATARGWRDFPLRRPFAVVFIIFFIANVAKLDVARVAADICNFLFFYMACVQVRDREPKDLFSVRKLAGAS